MQFAHGQLAVAVKGYGKSYKVVKSQNASSSIRDTSTCTHRCDYSEEAGGPSTMTDFKATLSVLLK